MTRSWTPVSEKSRIEPMGAPFLANTRSRIRTLFRDPSRRAKTSSGFGLAAFSALAVGLVFFWLLKDFGRAVLISCTVVSACCGLVAAFAGHTSRSRLRKISGRVVGLQVRKSSLQVLAERRALAGILLGYLGVLSPFLVAFTLSAAEHLRPNRGYGPNDLQAIESLRALNSANRTYFQRCHQSFATTLSDLGPPGDGNPADCHAAGVIDAELASGVKQGYRITYVVKHLDKASDVDEYIIRADPEVRGRTGNRSFYTDQTGVIRSSASGIATERNGPID